MDTNGGGWVLASADPQKIDALAQTRLGYAFAGFAADGATLLRLIDESVPSLVVADMTLPGLDGLALLERLRELPLARPTHVVLLSVPGLDAFDMRAKRAGAACVLRNATPETLARAVSALTTETLLYPETADETKILETLWRLGFSPKLKGTRYLLQAIVFCARDREYLECLTTKLYPAIARQNNTTAVNVHHAIRRSIDAAWASGSIRQQYDFFGNTIDEGRAKPTALAMIARTAEQFRVRHGKDDEYAY